MLLRGHPFKEDGTTRAQKGAKTKHRQSRGLGKMVDFPAFSRIAKEELGDTISATQQIGRKILVRGRYYLLRFNHSTLLCLLLLLLLQPWDPWLPSLAGPCMMSSRHTLT
jgi:hypothetical protein